MKLVVTDHYNQATQRFLSSLQAAAIPFAHLNIQYDGFLPVDVLNPFSYYIGAYQGELRNRYFNQIQVPDYYEIRNLDGNKSEILKGERVAGYIVYAPETNRLVKEVIWLDYNGKKISADRYNNTGQKYAEVIYGLDEKERKLIFLKDGEPVISWDLSLKHIVLYAEKERHVFANLTDFIYDFLERVVADKLGLQFDEVIYNTLATSHFLANRRPEASTLYWQEHIKDSIPGNMQHILAGKTPTTRIIFENVKQFDLVKKLSTTSNVSLSYLGAIESFKRANNFTQGMLTITRSDQILHDEQIATMLKDKVWTIAAPSEVSDKLRNFAINHPNVNLVERMTLPQIEELLASHDFYLDVNKGGDYQNVVYRAYQEGLLILSDRTVAKNPNYELVLVKPEEIIQGVNHSNKARLLEQQRHKKGKPATIADYQTVFG